METVVAQGLRVGVFAAHAKAFRTSRVTARVAARPAVLFLLLLGARVVEGFTPYEPTPGWTYALEASGRGAW